MMKDFYKQKGTFILTLLIAFPLTIFASNSKVGTSGAAFLKIGAGARPAAMGDAFVGVADDANALYFNPAGAAFLEGPEFTALHTQWFQNMNYEFGAFVHPSSVGSFGIFASSLKSDDLQKYAADESYQGDFETMDSCYGLSYSRAVNPALALGLNLKLIKQKIDTESAQAWAGDVGVFRKLTQWPMTVGFAIRNVGQKVKFVEESDPLPLLFDLGMGAHYFQNRLLLGLNLQKPRDNSLGYGAGVEWTQSFTGNLRYALRSGYNSAKTDADGATGVSLGAGLGYKQLDFSFAWVPFGDLGNTFRYSATFKF